MERNATKQQRIDRVNQVMMEVSDFFRFLLLLFKISYDLLRFFIVEFEEM